MIMAKMESAITGANWDEYLAMRDLINVGYEKEVLPAVTVDAVTNEESAKNYWWKSKEQSVNLASHYLKITLPGQLLMLCRQILFG